MAALELVVLLGVVILGCGLAAQRTGVAEPILLLFAGTLLGFVPALAEVRLPPELMLLVFLPALLYWESITTSLRGIRAALRGILLSSTLLVVITAAAVAVAAHEFLAMPWGPAWVMGGALAPTDATAVAAMARVLPPRSVTVLRAESLINDGTALVIYGVALGVTLGEETLDASHIAWLVVLSYVGGIAMGTLVARVAIPLRRRITDPLLTNTLILLLPFTSFLLAELIHASGVLAVVVCGLLMSQAAPRIGQPLSRTQTIAFWTLATFLLNAALFVLVGLEAHAAVTSLRSTNLMTALVGGAVVYVVILVVRLVFLVGSAYTIRMLDRRPSQRLRRVTNRSRVVSTVAGFRGAVSLAAALAVPTTLPSGAPFPDQDLIVFVTAGVVASTLVFQGLALAPIVRWARLPSDDSPARERRLATEVAAHEALVALPATAQLLGTEPEIARRVHAELEEHLTVLASSDPDTQDDSATRRDAQYTALRLALITHKRAAIVALRDERRIDDSVLRQVQAALDIEEIRLTGDSDAFID
jgi:monovalent cation/hydrogen antiporter